MGDKEERMINEAKKAFEEDKETLCLKSQLMQIADHIFKTIDYSSEPVENYKESIRQAMRSCSVITGVFGLRRILKEDKDYVSLKG